MTKDESRFLEPLQLAGKIIMENGGETYRVEETVTRMGRAFGLQDVESFAVPSGVFVSYRRQDGSPESSMKRVHRSGTNLMRVNAVNAVSREVEAGRMDCDQAMQRLREIQVEHSPYTAPLQMAAAALCAGGFSLMFHGGWVEFILAGLTSALGQWIAQRLERLHIQSLMIVLLESLALAFVPNLLNALAFTFLVEAVVAGALMPLLPGLAMTNAVQDAMRGDMLSGMTHGLYALLTAGLISGGTLMASALLRVLMGGGV